MFFSGIRRSIPSYAQGFGGLSSSHSSTAIGRGPLRRRIKGKSLDWGYAQWAKPLVKLVIDGTTGIADYQCKQILGTGYHRLAPIFPPGVSIQMDGVDQISYMVGFAQQVDLSETVRWLKKNWLPG